MTLISRANAIEAIQNAYCKPCKERGDDYNEVRCRACEYDNAIIQIDAVPSADYARIEVYRDLYEKYIDLKHKTAWIPVSERLPNELEAVNVTWVNHNPPVYYQFTKDIPQTDTAVRYNGNWYWWDSTVIDVLAEYGERSDVEQIDKDIEVVAWVSLPEPYREDGES